MLDTKYAVKYKMPHTLLHIVDNSAYTNPLPQDIAEDPSLYSSIVVTATPMGVDNKIVSLTRADVAAASFGLGNITTDDITRYGQSIEYPLSLIQNAKAPVKLLRVTPDGSTYAFTRILVQWKINEDTDRKKSQFVIRFKADNTLPTGLRLDRFKNTDKLNAEIVKKTEKIDGDWNQAVFMNVISAGRGKIYNDFSFAIDFGKQARRPSNCRYIFSTINTNSGLVVEEFAASLSNITTSESGKYYQTIDDVNTVVNQRMDGSSILIPYLNQESVKKVYADYTNFMNKLAKAGDLDDYEIAYLKTLNINIFDMIYGNYIYDGSQYSVKLPHYYVEMFDTNIKQLPENDRFTIFVSNGEFDTKAPTPVWNRLYPKSMGVIDDDSNVYVGDVYVSSMYANLEPTIDVVANINQYTGAITSVSYTNVRINKEESKKLVALLPDIFMPEGSYTGETEYRVTTEKPSAWSNTYGLYYVLVDENTYINVIPEFVQGVIYQTDEATDPLTEKPNDWDENFGNYYYQKAGSSNRTHVTAFIDELAPVWQAGTYYKAYSGPIDSFDKASVKKLINNGVLPIGQTSAVAFTVGDTNSYTVDVALIKIDAEGDIDDIFLNKSPKDILACVDYASTTGSGNIIAVETGSDDAYTSTDAAWGVPGLSCIRLVDNDEYYTSEVYVNGYDTKVEKVDANTTVTGTRIRVTNNTNKLATIPNAVNVDSKMMGHEYDIIIYDDTEDNRKVVKKATNSVIYIPISTAAIADATYCTFTGEGVYAVGDTYTASDANSLKYDVEIRVKSVDADGKPTAIEITNLAIEYDDNNTFDDFAVSITGKSTDEFALSIVIGDLNATEVIDSIDGVAVTPDDIVRYMVTGSTGSLIRPQIETNNIPVNYYLGNFGDNPSAELGGLRLANGSTGFFDDPNITDVEFKWRYSELLVKAFRGEIDPRIMSPVRCPAKFMFDGGFNTIVGQTILPNVTYQPYDIVNSATIFTEEEKEEVLYNPSIMDFVTSYSSTNDIDVKQAMYDLMIYRCYYGLPEDKRPIGPGFGLSVHFDAGITDYTTAMLVNDSFKLRFTNPNASWDIGGYTATNGVTYTYTKWIVDNLIKHCKATTINKPFVMDYATIPSSEYVSFFPDLDVTDWDLRELLYESGGNAWVPNINGDLMRRSQRTMFDENDTSDLLQESNMRTLSQLCYLLQNMIEGCLYSYTEDGVLQTMTDMCNNRFSAWAGNLVDTLNISFERDINPLDGADIVVCYCNVSFRGLFLRVPIIVNVNRRAQ